jgi:hypothetical protein
LFREYSLPRESVTEPLLSNDRGRTDIQEGDPINVFFNWGNREMGWSGIDWIDISQDMDHWTALGNTVISIGVL